MPDFLHSEAISQTLTEVRVAAQQAQVTTAAANELIANLNDLVLMLTAMLEGAMASQVSPPPRAPHGPD